MASSVDTERFAERVLAMVESIPPGRVMSYGAIASAVGGGGPRRVGNVLATLGEVVTWWRVVRADGTIAPPLRAAAAPHHRRENTPVVAAGDGLRVDMARAAWSPRPPA